MKKARSEVVRAPKYPGIILALLMAVLLTSSCGLPGFPGTDNSGARTDKSVTGTYVPRGRESRIWLVKAEGGNIDLVAVSRPKMAEDALTSALEELLKGPDRSESESGIGSEIPRGTILLGVKRNGHQVEVNLSRRFAAGGGPTSMETRLDQLARTVKEIAHDDDVFVDIEGERLSATSADGLEIAQPINQKPEFN